MTLTIGSLFSGIGGLELGLERAGLGPVRWQVEIDPFCRAVLAKHWPEVERHEDVRAVGSPVLGDVDLICGGFPCQDVSSAGKGAGLAGERSGLWFEYRRIVEELRPRIVVVENVASGKRRWLPYVRRALCELGYDTTALEIGAVDVGAPHRRQRVFVVAHANSDELRQQQRRRGRPTGAGAPELRGHGEARAAADTAGQPWTKDDGQARQECAGWSATAGSYWGNETAMPEPTIRRVDDGLPNRMDRLRALGNAVVPQVAEVVGRFVASLATKGGAR